jgi:hypothetical protein
MGKHFELDRRFEAQLLGSKQFGEFLAPIVDDVAEQAKRNTRSRGIAKGMRGEVGIIGERYVGRVSSNDFKTGWFEFGTSKVPMERALGRALEAIVGPVEQGRGRA